VFVRDRRAQRFMSELETAIERNFSDPEIVSLRARLRQLADLLAAVWKNSKKHGGSV
jgi:hypothetical protein